MHILVEQEAAYCGHFFNLLFGLIGHFGLLIDINISFFLSQHAPSRSIVCSFKLGCLGVVEDPTAVGRTTRPRFSQCSYVLDLDLAMSILPIQNFELVKAADRVRFNSNFKNSEL